MTGNWYVQLSPFSFLGPKLEADPAGEWQDV